MTMIDEVSKTVENVSFKNGNRDAGLLQSGKVRGKRVFFALVRESQGMSGNVREFKKKSGKKTEKSGKFF